MTDAIIETRSAKIWLGEDGIIRLVSLGSHGEGLAPAQENWQAVDQMRQGKRRPILGDIRKTGPVDAEGRKFYANVEAKDLISAVALLVESPISRVVGSLFLGLNRPPVPIRIFTSEQQALEWLRGFLKEEEK